MVENTTGSCIAIQPRGEDLYEELFMGANEIIFTTDAEGNLRKVNRKSMESLGYSENELAGQNILKIVHPEDCRKYVKFMERILEGKEE